ncbi:MAG: NosD domain-containing protein [Candidatus Bathyarchaeia archaeon]
MWCSSDIKITYCTFSSGKRVIIVSNSSEVVIAENTFADNYEQPTIWLKYSNSTIIYGNSFSCRLLE